MADDIVCPQPRSCLAKRGSVAYGRPLVHLCGAAKELAQTLRVSDILLSLAHCRAYATAYALAVRGDAAPWAS